MWGLQSLGQHPIHCCWSDFPRQNKAALKLGCSNSSSFKLTIGDTVLDAPFDAVWVRRRVHPSSMAGTHPGDNAFVLGESTRYLDCLLPRLGHAGTRWVNHPVSLERSKDKVLQLELAQALGFLIPATLIGNDIEELRAFFLRHPGGIVHKSLTPMNWQNDDGSRTSARTSQLSAAHLEQEFPVRACPAIYQEKIDKKYELRVTVMGDTVIAARIDSQRDGPTIDWRYDGGLGRSNLQRADLAPDIAERCRVLCRRLDLAFGCIDLIVTPSGDIIFLEVNNAGQFLFKELADPRLPMLDAFCRYLASGAATTPDTVTAAVTMANYLAWERAREPQPQAAAVSGADMVEQQHV